MIMAEHRYRRAAPNEEAHHCVNGPETPDTGRNSGGMQTIKKIVPYLNGGVNHSMIN